MPKKGGKLKKKSNFGMKKRKKSGKKNEKVKKKKGMRCVSPHHLVVACALLRAYRNNIYDGIIIVN
jgi:hypothetical protein